MSLSKEFKNKEGRFDIDLQIKNVFYGGISCKRMRLPKGHFAISHKHKYDHLSILAVGKCIVKTDDSQTTYTAPAEVKIPAGLHHEITAIEDVLWFCIHSTDVADDANGVLIDRSEH